MRRVGDFHAGPKRHRRETKEQPGQHDRNNLRTQRKRGIRMDPAAQPDVTKQPIDHSRKSAKERTGIQILRNVRNGREKQNQQTQPKTSMPPLDHSAKFQQTQAIEGHMNESGVNEYRSEQSPNF